MGENKESGEVVVEQLTDFQLRGRLLRLPAIIAEETNPLRIAELLRMQRVYQDIYDTGD